MLLASCYQGSEPEPTGRTDTFTRQVIAERWDTLWRIESGASDTILLLPDLVEAWLGGVALLDYAGQKLISFDEHGVERWRAGREGQGPGEFKWIIDLSVAEDGTLLLADAGNMRINWMDGRGTVVRSEPLVGLPGFPWTVVELAEGYAAVLNRDDGGLVFLDESMSPIRTDGFPWSSAIPEGVTLASVAAADTGNARWVLAAQYGPGFTIFSDNGPQHHWFVDPKPWATPDEERLHWSAVDVQATADGIYFLYGGRPRRPQDKEGQQPRWVDVYDWRGGYRESLRLPTGVMGFATDSETFYVFDMEPTPYLMALRPRRQAAREVSFDRAKLDGR